MITATKAYKDLLSREAPHAIHSDGEHREYLFRAEELMNKRRRTAAEDHYLELLSILIDQYEEEHQGIDPPEPVTALKQLMSANQISQAELSRLFGSSGITSEILSGKRELSKAHIKKLASLFKVSTDLFIQ